MPGITCDFSQDLYGDDRSVQNTWHLQRERCVRRPRGARTGHTNGLLDNDRSGCVQTMNGLLSSNSVKGLMFCGNPCAISGLFWKGLVDPPFGFYFFFVCGVSMDSTYLTRKGQWPKACLGSPLNFHFTSCDRACVCVTNAMIFQLNNNLNLT